MATMQVESNKSDIDYKFLFKYAPMLGQEKRPVMAHVLLLLIFWGRPVPFTPFTGEPVPLTLTGLDVLVKSDFALLKGKTVAVITNHSALDAQGKHLTELILGREEFRILAFLSPEHGFKGELDQAIIADDREAQSGLTIYSLYGKTKRPTSEMLAGLDVLVFDIQDIGTRFYTYQSTLLYAMESCAKAKVSFIVLDRPNPIGGNRYDGPMLDGDKLSFTGAFPMPVLHGMTMGELALMFNGELQLGLDLRIINCKNWQRESFEHTGLVWINPSPNIRKLEQAFLYPAVALLEYCNISVGRGTDAPFERFGAPWLDPASFCHVLNQANLPGLRFIAHYFVPESGPYTGETCGGVFLDVTDRDRFDPILTGYTLFRALLAQYSRHFNHEPFLKLLGNDQTYQRLLRGDALGKILRKERSDLTVFKAVRKKYLLYPTSKPQ